jgi:penicillin-insensitive murein endopeptidase
VALRSRGRGYQLLHAERQRAFGHPALVAYVQRLAVAARKARLGVVGVGDLSQARGGPTPDGHRSHQSGLDVDVSYTGPGATQAVVDLRTHAMTAAWSPRVVRLLATAATDPAVDRVFVNPAVKRAVCTAPGPRPPWLARLRPWWGHHDHFHVRLKCPADSPLCLAQEPPTPAPDGDGCGATLNWWFSDDAQATHARRKSDEADHGPTLPEACAALLAPVAEKSARLARHE